MTPEELVKNFWLEKEYLLKAVLNEKSGLHSTTCFKDLNLDIDQTAQLKIALNALLTDAFYTILLGLDGTATIGSVQHDYKIYNDNGDELTGGDIEAYAYEYFQEHK